MSKYRISSEKTNRLDYCPHCEEIWLDDGEWQLVESLVATGDFTKVFTQSWQYAVRTGITSAMEEQRLRELLGDDYARVAEFARWLETTDIAPVGMRALRDAWRARHFNGGKAAAKAG